MNSHVSEESSEVTEEVAPTFCDVLHALGPALFLCVEYILSGAATGVEESLALPLLVVEGPLGYVCAADLSLELILVGVQGAHSLVTV